MKKIIKGIVPQSIVHRVRNDREKLSYYLSKVASKTKVFSNMYYLFSNKFSSEHQAVLKGKVAYYDSLNDIGKSCALLRRNIHRLEKGLIMRPRRSIFAEGFIEETVLCYKDAMHSTILASEEKKWATDVLNEYFQVVGLAPVIDIAKKIYKTTLDKPLKLVEHKPEFPSGDESFKPYPYQNLPDTNISYDELKQLFIRRRSVRWYQDKEVPPNLVQKGGLGYMAYQVLRRSKNLLRMTTNSFALKELCIQAGQQPKAGIVVANNGSLELPLDELPNDWLGREGAFQVGYMGHLYPGRGVEIIIACAERLPDMDFHIVGGADRDIEYWKASAALPNLFFHGFVKHSETHKYRNHCDALLAPYQKSVAVAGGRGDSSKYMNPIKIIEYMSAKKTIICSDLPVLHEVLTHEHNALLCAPDDVGQWVQALERLRDDAALGQRLADQAYREFMESYTWQARAEKLIGEVL